MNAERDSGTTHPSGSFRNPARWSRRRIAAVVISIALVFAAAAYIWEADPQLINGSTPLKPSPILATTSPLTLDLSKAAGYLLTNYNSSLGLIPETPGSNTYWLYSDNFLAAQALTEYGRQNATALEVGQNITKTIAKDSAQVGSANQYALAMRGVEPCQFNSSQDYNVRSSGGADIRTTLNNGTGYLSGAQYADVAFLTAICLYESHGSATQAFDQGLKLFDGTGFRDLPYNQTSTYQTYKLALCTIAADDLGRTISQSVLDTMLLMQAPSGGFYTGYGSNYSTLGTLTNTETTSLAMIAIIGYL